MRKIIPFILLLVLAGCAAPKPTVQPVAEATATPTKFPTVLPPTEVATMAIIPTATPIPNYDPANPFRLVGDDGEYVELMNGVYTEIRSDLEIDNNWSWVTPELSDGSDLTAQLSHCMRKMIMANGYDGGALVGHKLEAYIHSGIAKCGQENSANFLRVFLEGEFRLLIDFAHRPEKMEELIGKLITFKQGLSEVEMKVVDIEMVKAGDWFVACDSVKNDDEEYKACTSKANGTLDRFFPNTGAQPGVREMFIVFCSAERDERVKSDDNYNKFILRLQP